ncbi:hypothetical protein PU634_08705 [Oceanimonas pelagia]|uniref:Surface antigen domain-containing protein n=1 Tax=Oceanimonas pelagia TaxID=3028314 RepID=A0AA50KJZ9_9GAMM|nr:DVU3141 family protein [Oceanimonas pelagia]WMC09210.1 hypothetical protein PU634_08705 [Oceanimonas pelagia]
MHFVRKPLAGTLVALCLTLAGCASQQENNTNSASTPLNQFLTSAVANATTTLPTSPWGANAQVTAGAPYFAASGKTCRPLQVTQATGTSEQHIACQTQNGEWQLTRSLREL